MKKLQLFAFSVLCAVGLFAQEAAKPVLFPRGNAQTATAPSKTGKSAWLTGSFEEAQKQAAAQKRPIFLLFTGTDWCPWCVRLENEILSKKEFLDYAAKNLILFKSEFPAAALRDKTKDTHPELTAKYNIHGFPTVLIVDKDGTVIGRTGYAKGGPVPYTKNLDSIIKKK